MEQQAICVVGLGYVGLPLAHAFAKKGYTVFGYDIQAARIEELKKGHDRTHELSQEDLAAVSIEFSSDPEIIGKADIIIPAIPTPVDSNNKPDLTLLEKASVTIGKYLKKGAIVVYESTVYPGVTEDVCGPILAKESGLMCGVDFKLGYSPERINPGDKVHTVSKIIKVVAGQDEETLNVLSDLYGSIVEAGIHRAPSIKVAEMAKAIENAQRDLNIAYMNEIAMLCNHIGIATKDVLDAARTKWNFLPFQPGLVGGHCIGVDPYYLVEKARLLGMDTRLITAGRSVNDSMSKYIAAKVCDALPGKGKGARLLVLGITFKEDVPDTRNSKVKDVVSALQQSGASVDVQDPFFTTDGMTAMGFTPGMPEPGLYDALLYLVPHKQYRDMHIHELLQPLKPGGVFYDIKSIHNPKAVGDLGYTYLAL
ncbi:MAG: UDP-glucose/GDP-mannose dehydrogenase family protein [Candidatus Peribacteria bacterium]|nr:UDP-glucose/GDP-mannose dehydrogenase family protein [Candidatus Peribacteria bacterium]